MKSVSIFGAGISGLTTAHELSEKGFEVIVYEKDENI
jgi:NADPH-dependent glutamate synthase beta subunit-like oxidoreductase